MVLLDRLGYLRKKGITAPLCSRRRSPLFLTDTKPNRLHMQTKKANFDVTHELDEFLMVEKPLTHSKRKVNPDVEKMKPELREMEEQYVFLSTLQLFTHVSKPYKDSPSTISVARNASLTIPITYPLSAQDTISKATRSHLYNHKQTP